MAVFKPLKYLEVIKILKNLGFSQENTRATSHETWSLQKEGQIFAVTLSNHGGSKEFKPGTLASIIRQSGFTRKAFYQALSKKTSR